MTLPEFTTEQYLMIVSIFLFFLHWITSYVNIFLYYDTYGAFERVFVSGFFPYTLLFKQKYRALRVISLVLLCACVATTVAGIIVYCI